MNLLFKFDEFCSSKWTVNADKIDSKVVIAHYYAMNRRSKRNLYVKFLADILKTNLSLFNEITARR